LDQTKSGHSYSSNLAACGTVDAGAKPTTDFLLTDDLPIVWRAHENPTKEEFYKEFFNGGANNVARAQNFRNGEPIIGMLARTRNQ